MKISVRDGKFRLSLRLPLGICLRAAAKACKGEGTVQLLRKDRAAVRRILRSARRVPRAPGLVRGAGAAGGPRRAGAGGGAPQPVEEVVQRWRSSGGIV